MNISGNVMNIVDIAEKKMDVVIEHLQIELKNIRTGRANPSILDGVTVEVYGTQMRLRDIATVASPESRQILITPFDVSNTSAIGKAIETSDMGFRPIVDANAVRINIPQMDESIRKEMVKQCKKKGEDCKIGIRNVRRECNDYVKKQKVDGEIPEDVMKSLEKRVQDLTDKFCRTADEFAEKKEKEVLSI